MSDPIDAAFDPQRLHRHQLVRLHAEAWRAVTAEAARAAGPVPGPNPSPGAGASAAAAAVTVARAARAEAAVATVDGASRAEAAVDPGAGAVGAGAAVVIIDGVSLAEAAPTGAGPGTEAARRPVCSITWTPRPSAVDVGERGGRRAAVMRLDALRHWAAHDLPVVVTRQPPAAAGTTAGARATAAPSLVAVGVPAPARWGRCRIALSVPTEGVRDVVAWPTLAAIAGRLPGAVKATLTALDGGLQAALGRAPRVYGSHAWQAISGLPCTRTGSDLDLLLQPRDAAAAAQAVALLQAVAGPGLPRLDGELLFDDGAAVAWREWAAWHDDRARQVLVKRLRSTALETDGLWAAASTATMANSARR